MRHRITLYGFSEAEYRAMVLSFEAPLEGERACEVVQSLADADVAVIDADAPAAIDAVVLTGRVAQAVFIGSGAPADARAVLPRPVDPVSVRRALAELLAQRDAQPGAPLVAPAAGPAAPSRVDDPDEIVLIDLPLLQDPVPPEALSALPPVSNVADDADDATDNDDDEASTPDSGPAAAPAEAAQRDRKAAARAAARRARLSHVHTDPGQLEHLRDVLVLDADAAAAAHLRELLDLFGFRVHVAQNIAQAADVLARVALVAAFLDVAVNGADQGDGVTLLQTIQDLPRLVGHPTPAVLLVTEHLRPSDKVRAALAGVNLPLLKPVTRGDVARALEACEVLLPSDARRSV